MSTVLRTVRIEGTESKSNARVGAPIGAGNEADLILRTAKSPLAGSGTEPRKSKCGSPDCLHGEWDEHILWDVTFSAFFHHLNHANIA